MLHRHLNRKRMRVLGAAVGLLGAAVLTAPGGHGQVVMVWAPQE